jgi:hypothetical protein
MAVSFPCSSPKKIRSLCPEKLNNILMKRTLLILALLISVAGFGQKSCYFGIGGFYGASGVTNQNAYGQSEMDYEVPSSYGFNVTAGYGFTDKLGLQLEVGYGLLGQKYSDTRDYQPVTRDIDLTYIQIPVLFKYNTTGELARFYLLAGPQLAFLTSANQDYLMNGEPAPPFYNEEYGDTIDVSKSDIKDRLSSFDLMARLDFGLEVMIAKNFMLDLGLTMRYGLMDLNAEDWQLKDKTGNYHASHNFCGGLNVGLNYQIPFK